LEPLIGALQSRCSLLRLQPKLPFLFNFRHQADDAYVSGHSHRIPQEAIVLIIVGCGGDWRSTYLTRTAARRPGASLV
jgi:hypothetical protein